MKPAFLLFLLLSSGIDTYGQPDSTYHTFIAKASLCHLQKDYQHALIYFEKAFQLQVPDALNAYKAAGAYALAGQVDKAFYYLGVALTAGWTEADWLAVDPYFDYLRKATPHHWKEIQQQAYAIERRYEQTLTQPALRKQLIAMTLNDQQLRYQRIQSTDTNETNALNQQIEQADLKNLQQAKAILAHAGWPPISAIGKDGQNSLWLLVQHADQDVLFQRTALRAMEKWRASGEINLEHYAFLYDRVQCNLNYQQRYGTQVSWTSQGEASGFRAIIQEAQVDERRKAMGLVPLRIYALTYGFSYQNITPTQAAQNESATFTHTANLLDSARYFYRMGAFQKVYDCYNQASMVLGGMTTADNYEAALTLAKIAGLTKAQAYKDIALDFLNLLYLRGELSKKEWLHQSEFKILHAEPRWIDMQNPLND